MTNYQKLQAILTELFEMDKADLDFGIYRIMNQKRKEVEEFINRRLPEDIKTILSKTQSRDTVSLQTELDQLGRSLDAAGVARESSPKFLTLQQQIVEATDMNALEQEIFSHLANFFKRYYKEGDFISQRRYKKDVYAIPYEGEEVKLHWANADQYYIKTSEYLKNYAFTINGGKKIHFALKEANTEQNNNKAQGDAERRFAIYNELPLEATGTDLYINFTYEPHKKSVKQDQLIDEALKVIQQQIPAAFADAFVKVPTEKNKNRTLIEKHLNDFVARNSFDYFIHKDLGGFLNRELDFFIKNEVLFIDDIETRRPEYFVVQLSKIEALKTVGRKIIAFLAQIEEFQKKLWLKKKFVVRTDYCITLDRIPEIYYKEIFANKEQLAEWKQLFDVDLHNEEQLHLEPYLVLDTKFFDETFKDRLLGEFENLDEETDGILINSENFQALNLMQEKYWKKLNGIYVDPPYNTAASEIIYKNSYKHSSWLSLLNDRVRMSKNLLINTGLFCLTIDDLELNRIKLVLDDIFEEENFLATTPIRNNPSGRSTLKGFSINHEYGLYYQVSNEVLTVGRLPHSEKQLERYSLKDKIGYFEWENLRRNGPDSNREDRPKQYYPLLVNKIDLKISIPDIEWNEAERTWILKTEVDSSKNDLIFPIHPDGTEKVWRYSIENLFNEPDRFEAKIVSGNIEVYRKKYANTDGVLPRTWWDKAKYSARDNGTRAVVELFKESKTFDFPKAPGAVYDSIKVLNINKKETILDYFAGSGTTGHATIKLNREDGGKRKYILVEMGTYFDTVTKPRIQKVIYSDNWKNGKPQDKEGISQMFKYQTLESYEDVLNNLQLSASKMELFEDFAQEEYLLKYMLDIESRDHLFHVEIFKNPFKYQLNITENNELKPTRIDLVETFNYLIGLYVERIQRQGDIKFVEGTTRTGEKTLIIWRNTETVDDAKMQEVFRKLYETVRTSEFDQIYINGDHHFNNFRVEPERFKVKMVEQEFFKRMFEMKGL
ncbi:MAG TPA: site-specific DNA-methyltransferase [Flavobacteriaceae bacterium]|nr:site-specific DNA-methyltransferase [Flavobacteriaceae bacterium]